MNHQLTEIFKSEYSNLVAVLCHYYKLADVQLAEDIVSETFLKAMKSWSHSGIPASPKSWLRKVAVNQLKDYYRRNKLYNDKILKQINQDQSESTDTEFDEDIINDSQLKMLFVVCNPAINNKSQICLALRILSGFNIGEIAQAFLTNDESINKTLYRAKKKLREVNGFNFSLSVEDLNDRLDNVIRILYLIFNEGYYSSVKEENIREDICWEAMRLAVFLTDQEELHQKNVYALLALMCFHASRISARKAGERGDLLLEEQDRTMWNYELIRKGQQFLFLAGKDSNISKYHIEAAIAYWHTTDDDIKWRHILQLYNRLLTIEYSPIAAINRTYALAKNNEVKLAIDEALKLNLNKNLYYICLLAELYKLDGDIPKEKELLNQAMKMAEKDNERQLIFYKLQQS